MDKKIYDVNNNEININDKIIYSERNSVTVKTGTVTGFTSNAGRNMVVIDGKFNKVANGIAKINTINEDNKENDSKDNFKEIMQNKKGKDLENSIKNYIVDNIKNYNSVANVYTALSLICSKSFSNALSELGKIKEIM